MAIAEQRWSALPVPYAIQDPGRIPKQRYYDPEFFAMEAELLWPRVWQMACRLEEIPAPGDFTEYEILDQSIIVVRVERERGQGLLQRVPPSRGQARRGIGGASRAGSPAPSTGGATAWMAPTRLSISGTCSPRRP